MVSKSFPGCGTKEQFILKSLVNLSTMLEAGLAVMVTLLLGESMLVAAEDGAVDGVGCCLWNYYSHCSIYLKLFIITKILYNIFLK